ncbi:MAG TPA: hemolysin activation protein [Prevotellaceae bacterium]|nr:hemolysin activation protein [Prevotellaceae bacterium]
MKESLVDVPVLILFFNRPGPLRQVFEQVRRARPSRLFLYQDGPRSQADMPGIMACREVVGAIDWDCQVERMYQERNYGCDPSEYLSQKWAFSRVDKCVVLEDDDVPAVSFFAFAKEMLDRYEHDERITMVCGFNVEEHTADTSDSYFFSTYFSIWGWASWRRVLDQWDERYTWLDDPQAVSRIRALAAERGYRKDFLPMCRAHRAQGKPFYETIFWAHLILSGGLCIVPADNMVSNLGVTDDSTHFAGSISTLPHGYRRIFTMGRHEMKFPLRHPRHVIEHVAYRHRAYRIMGWTHPWVKAGRSLEELYLNMRHGNWRHIARSIHNRIRKWMGKTEYR